ncbi:hypothetical protein ABIB14_003671 [Arthrobacter sp. UYEF3]
MIRSASVRVLVLEQLHSAVKSAFNDKGIHVFLASGVERQMVEAWCCAMVFPAAQGW